MSCGNGGCRSSRGRQPKRFEWIDSTTHFQRRYILTFNSTFEDISLRFLWARRCRTCVPDSGCIWIFVFVVPRDGQNIIHSETLLIAIVITVENARYARPLLSTATLPPFGHNFTYNKLSFKPRRKSIIIINRHVQIDKWWGGDCTDDRRHRLRTKSHNTHVVKIKWDYVLCVHRLEQRI